MALKMGVKPETVSGNIREMVQSGHSQKQAIASALSLKRKSMRKKMADGGLVSDDGDEGCSSDMDQGADRGLNELNELGRFKESAISNPEEQDAERIFAKKLYESAEKEEGYAHGGLVIGDSQMPNGSKPELEWENDGPSEPMSSEPMKAADLDHAMERSVPMSPGLSEDAKMAIENRKKKRRFSV